MIEHLLIEIEHLSIELYRTIDSYNDGTIVLMIAHLSIEIYMFY